MSLDAATERLIESYPDLSLSLGEAWRVSVAFAHMAFWDRHVARMLKRGEKHAPLPDAGGSALLNEVLLPEPQSV